METNAEPIYISGDIEASGKAPPYSMLSLGLCVVGDPDKKLYIEFKPLNEMFDPEAMKIHGLSMDRLKETGVAPEEGMSRVQKWVAEVAEGRPVIFASWGTFDWMYVKWYLTNFGDPELFGHNSIEIKSFAAGVLGVPYNEVNSKLLRDRLGVKIGNVHNALEDALEQGKILYALQLLNKDQKAERDSAVRGAARKQTMETSGKITLKG